MAERKNIYDVAVIGAGPGGLAAASWLVREDPSINVITIEAGRGSIRRCPILNKNHHCTGCGGSCQIVEGIGGACSAVSCGIFSTYPAGSGRECLSTPEEIVSREQKLLEWLGSYAPGQQLLLNRVDPSISPEIIAAASAEGIKVKQYATYEVHGDELDALMIAIQRDTSSRSADYLFNNRVKNIFRNGHFSIRTHRGNRIEAANIIFGTGRAGGEGIAQIWRSLGIVPDGMSGYAGIRFEDKVNPKIRQLREMAADPKFILHRDGKEVRLFCFCPEGKAVVMNPPGFENGRPLQSMEGCVEPGTGWMNYSAQQKFRFDAKQWEEWKTDFRKRYLDLSGAGIIGQSMDSFVNGGVPRSTDSSIHNAWQLGSVRELMGNEDSDFYSHFFQAFHRVLGMEITDQAHIFAPELHFWPVLNLPLNKRAVDGVYIVGDVGGDSRGILQAMDDGYLAARDILGLS